MTSKVIEEYRSTKPAGFSSDTRDLAYWANRAEEHSDAHRHRAKGGPDVPPKLHDTAERRRG